MDQQVTCVACRQTFSTPAQATDRWVSCPLCGEKNVNPGSILQPKPIGPGLAAGVGTLLVLGSSFGLVWSCFLLPLGLALKAFRDPENPIYSQVMIASVASALGLFVAGILLIRAGQRSSKRTVLFGGPTLVALVVILLLSVSGLIFVFTTCPLM